MSFVKGLKELIVYVSIVQELVGPLTVMGPPWVRESWMLLTAWLSSGRFANCRPLQLDCPPGKACLRMQSDLEPAAAVPCYSCRLAQIKKHPGKAIRSRER